MISNAAAGDTWRFQNGTYPPISLNCAAGGNFRNGSSGNPITIMADNERQALIQGTGQEQYVFGFHNCSWIVLNGFHVANVDFNGSAEGSVVGFEDSNNVAITRNIIEKANRYQNAGLLVLYHVSNPTVTENELYYAHRHGIVLSHVSGGYIARNYGNPRGQAPIAFVGAGGGNTGITCYPCNTTKIANNIMENWVTTSLGAGAGYDTQAWFEDVSGALFLGDISLNSSYGFLFNARGTDANQLTQPHNETVANSVALNSDNWGFAFRSPSNVRCDNCTAISLSAGLAGMECNLEGGSEAGVAPYSCHATNSLMINDSSNYGFRAGGGSGWSGTFDHNNAFGNGVNFSIGGGVTSTNQTTTNPNLGTCKIFIPASSPMKGAGVGGADIGANVLYQYDSAGRLTGLPLWSSSNGAFLSQGAIVSGLNDVAGSSLFDVQNRLNVNQNGCSLPSGYAITSASSPPSPGPSNLVIK